VADRWNLTCDELHRLPMIGEVLTVEGCFEDERGAGLWFEEIPVHQGLCSVPHYWAVEAFRPLVTRSQEQDLAIFRPILDHVREDA
jgi:hypothetical protein